MFGEREREFFPFHQFQFREHLERFFNVKTALMNSLYVAKKKIKSTRELRLMQFDMVPCTLFCSAQRNMQGTTSVA
jgi:hypothetical protein